MINNYKNHLSQKQRWDRNNIAKFFRDYLPADCPPAVIDSILTNHYEDAKRFVNVAARIEFLMYWYNIYQDEQG